MDTVATRPVRPPTPPGDVFAQLPSEPPAGPIPIATSFADFESLIVPAMTHWQHPSFFAYFPANSSPPSVLAEMLTATLGAQCMSWQTSPAATELEQMMMVWLRKMIGLPDGFEGAIQDSASTGTLCAILAARERATNDKANEDGLATQPPMVVYGSAECHSSIEKAIKIAGLGRRGYRQIPVDDATFAMRPDALHAAIAEDIAAGRKPICVVAAIGTTGTGAVDPVPAIAEICRAHGLWLHVDAAWAGSAFILPEFRWMADGIGDADSFVFNPHKWLFTNFDCSALYVRDVDALLRTLSILPEYLKTETGGPVRNYRDWSVPLGRRFRALKLWFVIRSYGVDGLRRMLRDHIAAAHWLRDEIAADPAFELMAPAPLALISMRYHPPGIDDGVALDRINAALVEAVNGSGQAYLTHHRVHDSYIIRVSIGQTSTTIDHVKALWDLLRETAPAARRGVLAA